MKYLFILNDPPYGTERSYNGFRHAISVGSQEDTEVKIFLIGDASACAKTGQKTPNGYYNIERMVTSAKRRNITVGVCGTCIDARGIKEEELHEAAHKSSMEELTEWTLWADKVIVY